MRFFRIRELLLYNRYIIATLEKNLGYTYETDFSASFSPIDYTFKNF